MSKKNRGLNDYNYDEIIYIKGNINGFFTQKEISCIDNELHCNNNTLGWQDANNLLDIIESINILKKDFKTTNNNFFEVFDMVINIDEIESIFKQFTDELIPKIKITDIDNYVRK